MSMFFLESFQVEKTGDTFMYFFHVQPILTKLLNATKLSGKFEGFLQNEKNKIEMRYKEIIGSIITATTVQGAVNFRSQMFFSFITRTINQILSNHLVH